MHEKEKIPEETVRLINDGNHRAFSYLYNEYFLRLCYFTSKLINHKAEAEIIVSDTFIKVWKLRRSFNNLSGIEAFMYVTSRNAAYDFLRYKNSVKGRKEVLSENLEELIKENGYETMINQIVQTELLDEIYKHIESLPSRRRDVFKAFYLDGLTIQEIQSKYDMAHPNGA